MKTSVVMPVYQSITFWICVALFLYFTGNLFFIIFLNSSSNPTVIKELKAVYGIVIVIKDVLMCLAFFATEPKLEEVVEGMPLPNNIYLDDFPIDHLKN